MGFFSWKTNDTHESICNKYSNRKPFTVYLIDNKGNKYREDNYEGYGEFGGKDYYELLAEMNGLSGRDCGIKLEYAHICSREFSTYVFPNIVEDPNWQWKNEEPENCRYQGYFYEDDYDIS